MIDDKMNITFKVCFLIYLISYILKKATNSGVRVSGTDISTKTGTSSYDSNRLKSLGLSTDVIQDAWTVTFSPDYSIAIWYGYDELTRKTYNTSSHAWSERTTIQKKIVNNDNKQLTRKQKYGKINTFTDCHYFQTDLSVKI